MQGQLNARTTEALGDCMEGPETLDIRPSSATHKPARREELEA